MHLNKKNFLNLLTLSLLLIVAILILPFQKNLILLSQGQVLEMVGLGKERVFEVRFCHSVNKGLVIERYKIEPDNHIYLQTGLFESYGAGMLDIVPDDVKMTDEGKFLRLDFPKRDIDRVSYAAAGIADHVLTVKNKEFHLFEEKPYKRITIYIENKSLFQKLLYRLKNKLKYERK